VKIHERQPRRRKVLIAGLLDFEIFRSPAIKWAYELSSLHLLVKRKKELYFNGTIQLGEVKQYVEDVEIESHSIEGYGDAENPGVVIYVQPKCASKDSDFDVWFRLHEPAPRYSRFHEPFLWIASFARHVLDYVENQPPKSVRLEGFHTKFSRWINARFGCNAAFKAWHAMYGGKSDFRLALNAHVDYIYQQACDLDNSSDLLAHPVWSHCMQGSEHIKRQAVTIKETIATPHVYACFAHMYFGEKLQPVQPCRSVRHEQAKRKRRLGFASDSTTSAPKSQFGSSHPSQALSIRAGDVIAFKPEEKDKQYWKKTEKEWYAYVQRVEPLSDGTERLFVLWIYRPDETNMFLAHYPIKKEVFLSDNCNCDEGILLSSDVSRKLTVNWLPEALDTSSDILIRQTYITQESSFVTLQNAHLKCACHQKKTPAINLRPGDTLYITKSFKGNKILEPVLVYKIDEQLQQVTVRMFLRLGRDCADTTGRPQRAIAPNELVLTDELVKVRFSRIERPCNIRLVFESETVSGKIPFPYDRGGAGDFWFLSMGLQKKDGVCKLVHLSRLPTPFKEGSNFVDNEMQKLHGLSIFSGGGNLDRGLEEGGAVEFKTAVDFSAEAIHTQRANSRDPEKTEFFCGSVDDHLAAIFSGRIPLPDVQLASAGSPWLVQIYFP
jgi:DNA (cytosine-5)-methyltransferase 1